MIKAIVCTITMLATMPFALAAEFSKLNVLGFSPDGNHFAWEEYGTTDAVSIPYGQVQIIEVSRDRWVKGYPKRMNAPKDEGRALEEEASRNPNIPFQVFEQRVLNEFRAELMTQAKADFDRLGPFIGNAPAAIRGDRQMIASPESMTFTRQGYYRLEAPRPDLKTYTVSLKTKRFPKAEHCYIHEQQFGFRLSVELQPEGDTIVLANDMRVPKSRGCPQKYVPHSVYTYPRKGGATSMAVILRYTRRGFEGDDGRFLVVTGVVPNP